MSIADSRNIRDRFLREYQHIRRAEGRGSTDSGYYRALPFRDLSGKNAEMWCMRAKTYAYFENNILGSLERSERRALDIADLGAGNCWMSYRLTLRKHHVTAIDIFSDQLDGLRAARHYPESFAAIEADFSQLPLRQGSLDLAIFNASLHYSTDYIQTFTEVRRCLRPSGVLAILDSPVYRKHDHGLRMVQEKHERFYREYGFASDALPSKEFIDLPTLRELGQRLKIHWTIYKPWYGLRWHLRPARAWLKGQRPPSRFWIVTGRFLSL